MFLPSGQVSKACGHKVCLTLPWPWEVRGCVLAALEPGLNTALWQPHPPFESCSWCTAYVCLPCLYFTLRERGRTHTQPQRESPDGHRVCPPVRTLSKRAKAAPHRPAYLHPRCMCFDHGKGSGLGWAQIPPQYSESTSSLPSSRDTSVADTLVFRVQP